MKTTRMIRYFLALLALQAVLAARAERVGNFEISTQECDRQSVAHKERNGNWGQSEKEQNLFYKVRIECKGTDRYEGLTIKYLVAYKMTQWPGQKQDVEYLQGSKQVDSLSPLGKLEFDTEPVGSSFLEIQRPSGRKVAHGKAQLRGLALKIMQGEQVVAELGKPGDMTGAWEEAEKAKGREKDDRMGTGPKRKRPNQFE